VNSVSGSRNGSQDTATRRVLLAFLGNSDYSETTYTIQESSYRDRLAFIPIYEHFSPVQTAYVIGTTESRWDMLRGFPHTPVIIPYGKSEADFWRMFDILSGELDLRHAEIIFDITHGFRAVPFFSAIFIRFLKYSEPTASLSHIFYGIFERGQMVTPVVDLAPSLDLLDWIDATTAFVRYGELEELSQKVKRESDRAWKTKAHLKPRLLGDLAGILERFSNLSRLTYVPLLSAAGKELSDLLQNTELRRELTAYAKPLGMLLDPLLKHTSRFSRGSLSESHFEAAKWYLENKRPTQSLLVLREYVLTRLCEGDRCDPYDIKEREKREKSLNELRDTGNDPVTRLWSKITDARNRAGHALMKRRSRELSPGKAVKQVERLLAETEEVLGGKHG
jgi:CRISPR-associated DxTHG motif protein